MPLYEYKCPSGHTFDGLGKPEEPRKCAHCDATALPQLGAPAFVFKGGGFYDRGRGTAGSTSK